MIKEALKYAAEMARETVASVDGREYSTVGLTGIKPPLPAPVTLHSITGLLEWMAHEPGDCEFAAIHVEDPENISVFGPLDDKWRQREELARVQMFPYDGFPFGHFMPIEETIIKLQSRFVRDDGLRSLIEDISRVGARDVATAEDDGTAQTVVTKNEIGRLGSKTINPIRTLAPWRTFREVAQPASEFLLRFNSDKDEGLPRVALFEADGGAWRLDAVKNIAAEIRSQAPDGIKVIV